MTASKPPGTVGELVRRRLHEIGRSPEQLAEAVAVPIEYIEDLIDGSRQPPVPGRTDIYERLTSFLRLRRRDLEAFVNADLADAPAPRAASLGTEVRHLLLALCDPDTARELEKRRAQSGGAELVGLISRLLDVVQGAARRILDDQVGLQLAAKASGTTYVAMRLRVLDFLEATPGTLTASALTEFLKPRIVRWDVELKTGVMRVVLRPWDRAARRPAPQAQRRVASQD